MKKLAILGGGSWGLTLANLACDNPDAAVCLWDRRPEKIARFRAERRIDFPVPVTLNERLALTDSLGEAISGAEVILLVVTSNGTREVLQRLRDSGLSPDAIMVNASKGIEFPSLKPMSEVFREELPRNPYAVLSGPTLAVEILSGLPTASAIACEDPEIAEYLQKHLSHERLFRLYSNTDVTGVELGGSLKNIFAIASGYMRAKKLGDNALAALLTRGLAEMTRFSVSLGADPQTLYGLSGLGDLMATCNSPLSRNYQVGARLAQGETLDHILEDLKVVAEGVKTTHAVHRMCQQMNLDSPIVNMVEACLSGPFSAEMIIRGLMSRKLKSEQGQG